MEPATRAWRHSFSFATIGRCVPYNPRVASADCASRAHHDLAAYDGASTLVSKLRDGRVVRLKQEDGRGKWVLRKDHAGDCRV